MNEELLRGQFGLEKENVRVDEGGRLALTSHPKAFGSKIDHPYIQTDFSESQIEMITTTLNSIEETHSFLEALHDIVSLELIEQGEYLWPSSNPPELPSEDEIPIARMSDSIADDYRIELADKYGRKRQLLSGIHYNFSFDEKLLRKLYKFEGRGENYQAFKDALYLRVARNFLKYRWILIYLTGASPVFDKTYIERCVSSSHMDDNMSYYFPKMNSLRNSMCGYRNAKPYMGSFHSVQDYVHDIAELINRNQLLNVKEFYCPVRIKTAKGIDPLKELLEDGIAYLELRFLDLNPLNKIGISKETMKFIHLFVLLMLLKVDEPFEQEDQHVANLDHDQLIMNGIDACLKDQEKCVPMKDVAIRCIDQMQEMVDLLFSNSQEFQDIIDSQRQMILNAALSTSSIIKSHIQASSYRKYHLEKAKEYAQESVHAGYRFAGYEDLELSTQLLLKALLSEALSSPSWIEKRISCF
ncbi:bifunctional glutamate--cysteine ligase GshA/glutathione synthetase GshB [Paenibacillus sp. N1-5-1-14]|nr:bifunctional glutamate--cysteine ligase GshA/glutathione synthetase GshB [Paenibacillus radicibacter]